MNKFSNVLSERFSQNPLESYANTFWNQKVFKPIATGEVRDENINFVSGRTSLMLEKMQTKQSFLSSNVSSSHHIPSYQTYKASNLNKYIHFTSINFTS